MNIYEVNLREEAEACLRENIEPSLYLQIKSRLLVGLMSLQRLNPDKWKPQILESFKANSPTRLKEQLLSSIPFLNGEPETLDSSSLESWLLSLCSLLEEKTLLYMLAERARSLYDKHMAHPRLNEIVALRFIEKYRGLEAVDTSEVLSEITGEEIKTPDTLISSLDHPKVKAAVQEILQDADIASIVDKYVDYLHRKAVEYFNPRLLDAVDMAILGLVNESTIYIDTQLRTARGLPPLRAWRNKRLTHLATLKRREASARLETIELGKPKGVKKRPAALLDKGKQKKKFNS